MLVFFIPLEIVPATVTLPHSQANSHTCKLRKGRIHLFLANGFVERLPRALQQRLAHVSIGNANAEKMVEQNGASPVLQIAPPLFSSCAIAI